MTACTVTQVTGCVQNTQLFVICAAVGLEKISSKHELLTRLGWSTKEVWISRGQLKCDDTRAETRFRLSAKSTGPFKSAGTSVQSNAGSRVVRFSGSNAGYTMFRGSVKSTGYPLHSPVSPSLPLPCVTMCHHLSPGLHTNFCVAKRRLVCTSGHLDFEIIYRGADKSLALPTSRCILFDG